MRRLVLAAVCAAFAAVPAISSAAPPILATSVTTHCQAEPGGTVYTVFVALNPTTRAYYGTGLFYHFAASSNGVSVMRPSPPMNPVPAPFIVGAGHYVLTITNGASSAGLSSPAYAITVPQYQLQHIAGRTMCVGQEVEGNVQVKRGALIHP
jgi:hypothetical protein